MKRALFFLLFLTILSSPAFAGQIYGTLFLNNQPLAQTVVVLTCGAETGQATTDGSGVYRIFVRATGNCSVAVDPNGRNARGSLYSYDRPTAYDFDVINQGGQWILSSRRR